MHKLTLIIKTYRFNLWFEAVFVQIEVLYRPQNEAVSLIYSLIELPNLSKVQKILKRDNRFKEFAKKCIQDMVKDEISTIVNNPKLSISSSKISLDAMEGLSMSTINNKYTKNMPILQFILRTSPSSIGIPSHFSCWKVENLDANNESNENEA